MTIVSLNEAESRLVCVLRIPFSVMTTDLECRFLLPIDAVNFLSCGLAVNMQFQCYFVGCGLGGFAHVTEATEKIFYRTNHLIL